LVLIGITPTYPHTGLGYIHMGNVFDDGIPDSYTVAGFKEKPEYRKAKEFVESGNYLWNSGIFISKCSVMLDEIRKYMPNLYNGLMQIQENNFDPEATRNIFENLESISIDYGVMEKSQNKIVLKADIAWDDIGDFGALERHFDKDEKKNVVIGKFEGNAANCIILSQGRKIVANNVEDLVIVDTKDATLICLKENVQNIKKIIELIKEADLAEYLEDYVENPSKHIISFESAECDIETDGLIALIGVGDLEIKRTENELVIEGTEQII
jgi:mannose-1-phosphate guanylyltransferase